MIEHPNVLWLFCDQLRYHALASSGDSNIRTPNLDRLAAQGVRWTNAYSQYPVCMPFRGGLITGQHAHINGVRVHGDLLQPTECTVAHAFRAAGYRTSWVGKWHLASNQGIEGWSNGADYWVHPYLRAGFEDWYGFDCSNHYYNTRYSHGESIWPPLKVEGYQTDGLTDISLKYLRETALHLDQPWFHCLSVEAPHGGTDDKGVMRNPSPPEFEEQFDPETIELRPNVDEGTAPKAREKLAQYYGQILNLDHNIGRVLDFLDENKLAENTLVVFFSDHGDLMGSHGMFNKSVPLEESIHIPLIMRLPGRIPEGRTIDDLISGVDIFPTTAGLCEVPRPPEVQGLDLSGAACGKGGLRQEEVLIQWLGKARYGFDDYAYRAIRTKNYTYAVASIPERCYLFDNCADPFQQHNLYGQAESTTLEKELIDRLCAAVIRSGEALPDFLLNRKKELHR